VKLYATLENSRGQIVKLTDNEEIVATVYEGNKKQYAVHIQWCNIGDIPLEEGDEDLPEFHAEKGSIVTVREWRNEGIRGRQKPQA